MKNLLFPRLAYLAILLTLTTGLFAQQPPMMGGAAGGGRPNMNIGRFYGKIVDEKGKGVGYATVELYGMKFDTASRSMKQALITGQITEENGDFSLENLPAMGDFTLKVSFLGYADTEKKVSFGLSMPGPGGAPGANGRPQGGAPQGGAPQGNNAQTNAPRTGAAQTGGMPNAAAMSAMASKLDQDLGNITLEAKTQVLNEVVITGQAGSTTLALDRKVFRMDKLATSAGGTAVDALKAVPSLSVDLDGNVTMRNASPQIFIDGRPTTLTLDQIAADAIESVEVITNPSAKYDASGGQAGIVNIVLKKDRRIGYNGNVRLGADTQGGTNTGLDLNAREGKINVFLSANLNRMRGNGVSETERQNLFGEPQTNLFQHSENTMKGLFAMGRAGFDWFVDNRNTLTFSGSYVRGKFNPSDVLNTHTDSLFSGRTAFSDAIRNTENERNFRNLGATFQFKHLFPKQGKEWTADVNYNSVTSSGEGNFTTQFPALGITSRERQQSDGGNGFYTLQTDYVDPINQNLKLEMGARAQIRNFRNDNLSFVLDPETEEWTRVPNFADLYRFDDAVYAAYANLSYQQKKWGYMLGLRAESSQYTGNLPDSKQTFENDYPLSLFPSLFVTRKLNEQDNIQFSYTRRINRPNFFQLMPFTDYSDSLNLQRGNPDLLPEFTNSLEASYLNQFGEGHNILLAVYYKQATDLITRYQFSEYNEVVRKDVVVSSFANSNSSQAYGVEMTLRNTFFKNIELTSNLNLFNARVDASNVESGLVNERFTWFLKENVSVKLPAQFTFQILGEYRSRAAYNPVTGSGRFGGGPGGGGHMGGGPGGPGGGNTAQGYSVANWFVDLALRKDLFNRKASLTLNVSDIFRTRRFGSYTESAFFVQESWRRFNPQVARLNFSYRFGKMDTSLFKRKNTNVNMEGNDMMQ